MLKVLLKKIKKLIKNGDLNENLGENIIVCSKNHSMEIFIIN